MEKLLPPPRLAIVIPCYNEEEALPLSLPVLLKLLDDCAAAGDITPDSYILCSNDGSRDRTWQVLEEWHLADPRVRAISLAHNRGHQYALLAGLMTAMDNCDAAVSIDADLQDDPQAIVEMVRKYRQGKEIVYGVRSSRKTDTMFKRSTAHAFYSFQKKMGLETVYDHADYRLMSNRALHLLSEYRESNMFLRGIVPQIGFRTSTVEYERKERLAGESKYPLKKMLSFAFEGITSFSVRPLKIATTLGIFSLLVCLAMLIYCIVSKVTGHAVAGWASIGASVWALGGLQLFMLGIIGEYVGKIYTETKHRPKYIIESIIIDREKLEK